MKKFFVGLIISVTALSTVCGIAGCSKGSTMNGETIDARTEQIRLNESNAKEDFFAEAEKYTREFDGVLCPECRERKMRESSDYTQNCPDGNLEKDCEDKNCEDENKCKDCKDGDCKKNDERKKPYSKKPRVKPGKNGKLPKKPHRIPPKSIVF